MFVISLIEPGPPDVSNTNTLVFVITNSGDHGVDRIKPAPYECECGTTLTPEALDRGNKVGSTSAADRSWRDGGRMRCPVCGSSPSIDAAQRSRALGFDYTAPEDQRDIPDTHRDEILRRAKETSVCCGEHANDVTRMVPPEYGGDIRLLNLAPICDEHLHEFSHKFADILIPEDWHRIEGVRWIGMARTILPILREREQTREADILSGLMKRDVLTNPYPYLEGEPTY